MVTGVAQGLARAAAVPAVVARLVVLMDEDASVVLAAQVRQVARLWRELEKDLDRRPRPSRSEKVTRSEAMPPAPGDVDVMDARREVEMFAAEWAALLIRTASCPWCAVMSGTSEYLDALLSHVGHFTETAELRRAFVPEVERVLGVVEAAQDPDPTRWNPIGVPCAEGCGGEYRIELPDIESSVTEGERIRTWKDTRPVAVCSKNRRHTMDAMLANRAAVLGLR
jgi:hypothetical protein